MSAVTSFPTLWAPLGDNITWPCTVRVSARVKRVKISVDGQGLTEIILPSQRAYTLAEVQRFLESMLPWLQQTVDGLLPRCEQAQRAEQCLQKITGTLGAETLPFSITLPPLQRMWHVELQPKRGGYAKIQEKGENHLVLYAHGEEVRPCCKLLQKWLMRKALPYLQEKTHALAEGMGLEVAKVSVGAQKGRWGSCSAQGNIRLNCRLMLLPPHLVQHVLVHELCHRVHMNHSSSFKKLLEQVSPDSVQKDKDLARAWKNLPLWSLIA